MKRERMRDVAAVAVELLAVLALLACAAVGWTVLP